MSVPRAIASILAAISVFTACDSPSIPDGVVSSEISDSAGIRVVSNASPSPPDSIELELLWEYGTAESHYPFEYVFFGVQRDDGVVVVADGGGREVIGIDPNGEGHVLIARAGQGPHEVGSPRQVVGDGGSVVWVEDVGNGKLLMLEGDSVQVVLTGNANPTVREGIMPIGIDLRGKLLMTTARFPSDFDQDWLDGSLVTFDASRNALDTVASFPMVRRGGEPPVSPFGPYGTVTTAGASFVTGRTDLAEMTWRLSDGTVTQIARWSATPRAPDADDWEAFEASMVDQIRTLNPRRAEDALETLVEEVRSEYILDENQPVRLYDNLYGAQSGAVWIAPFTPSRGIPDHYFVMSSQGEWVATVEFSRPFRVLHMTDERVIGVHVGEFGVQTVAAYSNTLGR